jgi:hypothetical protein
VEGVVTSRAILWTELAVTAWLAACGGSGHDVADAPGRADASLDAAANAPPVAIAGPDVVVAPGAQVSLDGTDSYDPEAAPLTYSWLLASAPSTSAASLAAPDTAMTMLVPDVAGVYIVSLVVSDGELGSPPDTVAVTAIDGAPLANAGADRTVPHGTTVVLDGTASIAVDGGALGYSWSMAETPAGSAAMLDDPAGANPSFVADVVGDYAVDLIVSDGTRTSLSDRVVITATNTAPDVSAGPDLVALIGETVDVLATATDLEADPLAITWTVTAKPPGSTAAPAPATTLSTQLLLDVPGLYRLTVTASDGASSTSDEVVIGTAPDAVALAGDVVDAEYSRVLDRLVVVSTAGQLAIADAETGTETVVAIPLPPAAVSVAPDGLEAVVGHDGFISVVDVSAGELVAAWPTSAVTGDVVTGGNGYAYVFPVFPSVEEKIRCVDLVTGTETLEPGVSSPAGSRGRVHPTQAAIYVATSTSPGDIEKHDIAGGTAVFVDDSPYHGDYPMSGDLWLSEDGTRIFTNEGHVFRASTSPSLDMRHIGSLPGAAHIRHLDDSAAAHLVAVVPANPPGETDADTRVDLYDQAFLELDQSIAIPWVFVSGEWVQAHGRFAFFSADGTRLHVVVTATPSVGPPRTLIVHAL